MDLESKKLRIIIDIYRTGDIENKTVSDIGNNINRLFQTDQDDPEYSIFREVLILDDVIGRQIKVNRDTYIIMLASYKSLLIPEVVNPWSWNKYWHGAQPTIKFIIDSGRVQEIKDTADFHFTRSQMMYYPYLIIIDVDESDKDDISQLFRDIGFSLSKIIFTRGDHSLSNDKLHIMVKMIDMKLWDCKK